MQSVTRHDRERLRTLARKQLEYANLPIMRKRIAEWYEHNDLRGKRPMIQLELWSFREEIVHPMLVCETPETREIEELLLLGFLNYELFDDDCPVPAFFPLHWDTWLRLYNLDVQVEEAEDAKGDKSVGYRFVHPIRDLEADLPKLGRTTFGVDREKTLARKAFLEDIFGDILPVRIVSSCLAAYPTYMVVQYMGMENMFLSMLDCPDEFHALMEGITQGYSDYFRWLADEGLLLPTNGHQQVGQGTWGYTRDLPGPDEADYTAFDCGPGKTPLEPVGTSQSWGYLNSQETSSVSPAMYGEFVYPYYKRLSELSGMLSYGCCEPVEGIWQYVSKYHNLRKVSVPPWSDENTMGELLRGTGIIYHRKPSPNYLGVGSVFDEEGFTDHIATTMQAARGCGLEITMRDIYTINGDVAKARRAIAIIRRLSEKLWD